MCAILNVNTSKSQDSKLNNFIARKYYWHEIGLYDLPSKINYILEKTNSSKLHYVGHSQGWTSFLVMLTMLPEYNKKIISSHGLSPVAFMGQIRNSLIQNLASNYKEITNMVHTFHFYEFDPTSPFGKMAGNMLCGDAAPTQAICLNAIFSVVGSDFNQLNRTALPYIIEHLPAAVSWKQVIHYGQLIQSKKFQMFDLDNATQNVQTYGKSKPPPYNLSAIEAPMALYYGTADRLLASKDARHLAKKLKRNVKKLVRVEKWNHVDFIIGIDADKVIYKPMMRIMNKANEAYLDGKEDINYSF